MENQEYRVSFEQLKSQVKTEHFKNKEQLFEYLIKLKQNGMNEVIDSKKIQELLDLYDDTHSISNSSLNLENYKSAQIEDQNLIVAKQQNRILETDVNSNEYHQEFAREQNELSALNMPTKLPDANQTFESMSNKKIEVKLISLEEALISNSVDVELLNKIRFLVTSGYVNPHIIEIEINKEIFYNKETADVYEIKYNPDTKQYEIYKNNQLDYTEQQIKDNQKEITNVKTRKLEMTSPQQRMNNAAFTKISFLILNTISIGLIITIAILLNK